MLTNGNPNMPHLPRYIALCGYPRAGKTEAQNILAESFGVLPVDDGAPLREFAMENFGLTREQVSTQAGKSETVTIAGKDWVVRDLLGELGNALEAKFGKDVMPFMAMKRADARFDARSFSFGSVRRDQGLAYKASGDALVIEIRNPNAHVTGYAFDEFDRSAVDYVIQNDALARGYDPVHARCDLGHKLWSVLVEHALKTRVQ